MTAIPQHMQALATANTARLAVASFKRDLKGLSQPAAVHRVARTIEDQHNDPLLGAARVKHLLQAIPHVGETKTAKLLTVAQIYNYDKRLRDLTPRQRRLLSELLRFGGWRA